MELCNMTQMWVGGGGVKMEGKNDINTITTVTVSEFNVASNSNSYCASIQSHYAYSYISTLGEIQPYYMYMNVY